MQVMKIQVNHVWLLVVHILCLGDITCLEKRKVTSFEVVVSLGLVGPRVWADVETKTVVVVAGRIMLSMRFVSLSNSGEFPSNVDPCKVMKM